MQLSSHIALRQPELRTQSPQAREFYRNAVKIENGKRKAKRAERKTA